MNMSAATTSKVIAAIIMRVEMKVVNSSNSVGMPASITLKVRVVAVPRWVALPSMKTVIVQIPVMFGLEEVLNEPFC